MNDDGFTDFVFLCRMEETGIAFGDQEACVCGCIGAEGAVPVSDSVPLVRNRSGDIEVLQRPRDAYRYHVLHSSAA